MTPQRRGRVADESVMNAIRELPVAALSRPRQTLARAELILNTTRDPEQRSYAGQARGIALRELGDVRAAIRQLKSAARDASHASAARQADVSASLGVTLAVAGRSADALALLESALSKVSGVEAARIRVRQGSLLGELGRFDEAARALQAAARTLRRAGDATWESRAELNLSMVSIELGQTKRAETALTRAEELLTGTEHTFEAATARQYRGLVAVLDGRIPDALGHYDVARRRFTTAGTQPWELADSRASALLSAGLPKDALASAEQALALLQRPGAGAAYRARALVRAGEAAVAAGDPLLARTYNEQALRLFTRQGRDGRAVVARLGIVRARHDMGQRNRRLLRDAVDVALEAGRRHLSESVEANLIAGEIALDLGDADAASRHLRRAERARNGRSDLAKVLGWRATALRARAQGRRGVALRACEAGLTVLEGHQRTLGAIETRAAATTHGQPLARLALGEAIDSADVMLMLRWAERWRATIFAHSPVRSNEDANLVHELAQLRLARRRLDEATRDGEPTRSHEREVQRLESDVRARTLRASATTAVSTQRVDIATIIDALGERRLVEICPFDDTLHVLVVSKSGVRHYVAGSHRNTVRTTDYARFALRRTTHRSAAERARTTLPTIAANLEAEVFGPAVTELGDGPLVLVPPAALSSAPWGLLPSLRDRDFTVAPSAASWFTAAHAKTDLTARTVLLAGPGLRGASVEIDALAQLHPQADVLGSPHSPAFAASALTAMDGASLAHIAAHGTFRDDNPMFSSLVLEDGPLTVFDLQQLRRAPHRLVLSCCDTGTVSAAGADEMLGLLTALTPLGTAGMIAAVVPISDAAGVDFATTVHRTLLAGATSGRALQAARIAAQHDPAAFAIAHAFIAFGAA